MSPIILNTMMTVNMLLQNEERERQRRKREEERKVQPTFQSSLNKEKQKYSK